MSGPSRAHARVERAAAAAADDRSLRAAVLDAIREAVPFDAYAWVLTDPVTEVGGSPLAEIPVLADLPRMIRLKYLTPVNRWTGLPVDGLATLAEADPARSLLWRGLLAGYGVCDVASAVLRDAHGCWGFLDLWRRAPAPPFMVPELALLRALLPGLTRRVRMSTAATFTTPTRPVAAEGPAVLLLTDALEQCAGTPEGDARLRALLPTPPGHSPVPAVALNVAAQLLAREAGVDAHPPTARVHQGEGRWVEVRAARLDPRPSGPATLAVTIEPIAPTRRVDVYCRAIGLSARESDVVGWIVGGADTRRAARELGITEHTVNDHLRSVFAKSGTHSRAELVRAAHG